MSKYRGLYFILSAMLLTGSPAAGGPAADSGNEYTSLFKSVAQYNYGPDRTALAAMDSILISMLDQPEKLKIFEKLIDRQLASDISPAAKAYYCEKLGLIGTRQSIPVLTLMLSDDTFYDMALYALTGMPDKNADKRLRQLLTQYKGRKQIGIIQALGTRQDIDALRKLHALLDAEKDVARAAILAIGRIGSRKSIPTLQKAWIRMNPELLPLLHETLMKCTQDLDNPSQKSKIYIEIMRSADSEALRTAAFRNWVLSDPTRSEKRLLRILNDSDSVYCCEAVSLLYEMKQIDHTLWASRLSECPYACQVSLLHVMAAQKWTDTQAAVISMLHSPDADVRSAALFTLSQTGDSTCVTALAEHAAGPLEAGQAQETLDRLTGPGINRMMLRILENSEPGIQKEIIAALGRRNAREALDPVIRFSLNPEPGLRNTAIEALGHLADESMIADLLNRFLKTPDGPERRGIEKALLSIANRHPEYPVIDSLVVPAMKNAPDDAVKIALLELSGKTGQKSALPLLKEALNGKEPLSSAAIRGLSGWPDAGPVPELLQISETSENAKDRILALRGALRLIEKDETINGPEKLNGYRQALSRKQAPAELRLILSGLSRIEMIESLDLILPWLDREDIKTDAETAAVKVLEASWWRDPVKAAEILNRLKESDNPWVRDTSAKLLIRLM